MHENQKALLDAAHSWPSIYPFKFIIPTSSVEPFLAKLLPEEQAALEQRLSENGRYIAFTFAVSMNSSDEVLAVYARLANISGILSL